MLELRKAEDRGHSRLGWLDSRHTFSFGHYHDPDQTGFSDLLVINDDTVSPAGGFGTHPHRDMEIFTYVLSGALEHKDSMGNGSVIHPGDVQMMSAGTGVTHSEFNPSRSEPVHFLQIWVVPDRTAVPPRYQQVRFQPEEKRGNPRLIISPDGRDGSLSVYQDARVFAGLLDRGEQIDCPLAADRYAYLHVARGSVRANGHALGAGDGVRIRGETSLRLDDGRDAEFLLFDLRPRELPEFPG